MAINITAHEICIHGIVEMSNFGFMSIIFPFPLLTETGLPIQTESGKDISIDSGAKLIPRLIGTVPSRTLHVVVED